MIQTTTIWLEASYLVTILIAMGVASLYKEKKPSQNYCRHGPTFLE